MKTTKTFKVVILPTEKASDLVFDYYDQLCYKEESLKHSEHKRHLYILSDEEIKEGDWFIDLGSETIHNSFPHNTNNPSACKKIVATTDTSLTICEPPLGSIGMTKDTKVKYLPELPESFIQAYIKAYNEGKPITEVDLEMEKKQSHMVDILDSSTWDKWFIKIKTRSDNTVIVHQSKMYSRDEVLNLINKYDEWSSVKRSNKEFKQWIQDNL